MKRQRKRETEITVEELWQLLKSVHCNKQFPLLLWTPEIPHDKIFLPRGTGVPRPSRGFLLIPGEGDDSRPPPYAPAPRGRPTLHLLWAPDQPVWTISGVSRMPLGPSLCLLHFLSDGQWHAISPSPTRSQHRWKQRGWQWREGTPRHQQEGRDTPVCSCSVGWGSSGGHRGTPGHLHWGQVLRLWVGLCAGFWRMEGWEPHQIQHKCLTFTGSHLTFLWALFSLRLHD